MQNKRPAFGSNSKYDTQMFAVASLNGDLNIETLFDRTRTFCDFLTSEDIKLVEDNWQEVVAKYGLLSKELGTLWEAKNNRMVFFPTEYKHYRVLADPESSDTILEGTSINPYKLMRVSSVGAAILTNDGKILVQRRKEPLTAGGLLDSGAAGFCIAKDGKLDFNESMLEKISRELNFEREDAAKFVNMHQTGAFSSGDCLSGMVSYLAEVDISFDELRARANGKYVAEMIGVDRANLPDFIVDHYVKKRDLVGDGCATLLTTLDKPTFLELVKVINSSGRNIQLGELSEGQFVEQKSNLLNV